MKRFLRNNGLSLAFFVAFLLTLLVGQLLTGYQVYNEDFLDHGFKAQTLARYVLTGHFLEATMENWESEFLQMFTFVLASAWLFQRGSAESRNPEETRPPRHRIGPHSPAPAKRGGWAKALYGHSLSIAFLLCFLLFFWLHAVGGAEEQNRQLLLHGGGPPVTTWKFMAGSQFWFESFQNWQSEFLSVAAVVVFSIFLREKGSSQSKPVESTHSETGTG
ncbi:MAG TPA: DUF6766 family protein [Fibrobacteria bacterium]|nr:DUF6766 family protein [Fibrobacteria bacterium]